MDSKEEHWSAHKMYGTEYFYAYTKHFNKLNLYHHIF